MNKTLSIFAWGVVGLLGVAAIGVVAIRRGEPINALWLVVAATRRYALGYRFYSKFIAAKISLSMPSAPPLPSAWKTGATFWSLTNGLCSDITSPPSRDRDPWSGRCSLHSSDTFPERSGCWLEPSLLAAYKTS